MDTPEPHGARRWRLVRARTDAVPASVRRFGARARERRLRAVAPWLATALVLAVVALVGWVVLSTSLFGVREIQVSGVQLLTAAAVRDAAQVPSGSPLARVDLRQVSDRVRALAPVADAEVLREWPTTLTIVVRERTPVMTVAMSSRFALVDAHGIVFFTAPTRVPQLPLVRVPHPGPDDETTQSAVRVVVALTPQLRALLVLVIADAPARIALELTGGRRIIWGDGTESVKKARIATSLLPQLRKTIDVSAPDVVTMG